MELWLYIQLFVSTVKSDNCTVDVTVRVMCRCQLTDVNNVDWKPSHTMSRRTERLSVWLTAAVWSQSECSWRELHSVNTSLPVRQFMMLLTVLCGTHIIILQSFLSFTDVTSLIYQWVSPLVRSTIGDRALAVAGPRAWNNLPVDLCLSGTFSTFKTHLKSYLFNISFHSVWLYHCPFYVQSPWSRLCCIRLSKFVIITLHYIFDNIEILIPSDSIFPSQNKIWNFNSL